MRSPGLTGQLCRQLAVLLGLALSVFATSATAKPTNLNVPATVDRCHGNTYDKYRYCLCGQEYAHVEKKKDIPNYDLHNYYVFMTKVGKERYYHCRPCSICEDGRVTIATCHENWDTTCGACIHPLVYDEWTKSCQPKNMNIENPPDVTKRIEKHDDISTEPQKPFVTTKPTPDRMERINGIDENVYDKEKDGNSNLFKGEPYVDGDLVNDDEKSSEYLTRDMLIIIICVSAVLIVLSVVAIVVVRRHDYVNCTTNTGVVRSDVIRQKDDSSCHGDETSV